MNDPEIESARIRMFSWLQLVEYEDWRFQVMRDGDRLYLQLRWKDTCSVTGAPHPQSSRKWLLSPYMTKSEFVQTCLKAVLTAMEHEVRERFKYKGEAVYRPHYDVDALHHLCTAKALDYRKPPKGRTNETPCHITKDREAREL